jgi:tetratricopeptide (TPR) repeat protein
MTRLEGVRAAACAGLIAAATAAPAIASPESDALRAKAANYTYNLDHDLALATFREAVAADPQDAGALRGLASSLWLSITFKRGNMTVDDYLGRPNKPNANPLPPPGDAAAGFKDAVEHAIALARQRIAKNAKDADAHYQLGSAVGLRASYTATVDGSVTGAFRAAREAYEEEEKALELQPARKDAGLIVGTYRYIVAALSLPLRMVAYVAGFGGGKEKGITQIEQAAGYGGDNQTEARFALILLYNREKRYDDALKQLTILRERYARNRLVWLESGSTSLRAGRAADAERFLTDGLARFADDTRPRMFGEDALWQYKRGAALAALGRVTDADADLRKSLSHDGRKWVHGRAHLELARIALKAGNKAAAVVELRAAIALADSDNDPLTTDEARRLLAGAGG